MVQQETYPRCGRLMATKKFYLTTTLPYVNAPPHIGFALEIVQADAIARYHRDVLKEEVFFNTGTDEHGVNIYRRALEEEKDPQAYADEYAAKFDRLKRALNLSYTNFTRTTDPHHVAAAQEFWRRCDKNGDIYKKNYEIKYCTGCELEKTDSELVDGRCPLHPTKTIEIINEENYFFRFSKYQKPLLELYASRPDFVLPAHRLTEIRNFVEGGLVDFSISRLKSKMPWGIPVPGDLEQVMYVWFDALINYISTLGWPEDETKFNEFWPGIQLAGKDNLRQQSAIWQAMLISAGLPNSKQILIHGFITSGGEKMSKSLGNVVDPFSIVEKYGTDALRYFLLKEISTFGDGDFTIERFEEVYNADLANGLGNLVSRVMKMAVMAKIVIPDWDAAKVVRANPKISRLMEEYQLDTVIYSIWEKISWADAMIQKTEPFKILKVDRTKAEKDIISLLKQLKEIAVMLQPFMPYTSDKIINAIIENKKPENLFPRED